ncbi:polyketide cyclase/dehydrase/lipid transport protein [Azospirillum baldaniorum]|uniref:SRPBCC family protein n=1 Tax=Azospirillum baldaniorum TaxID=1064539 RepID=UPI0011A4E802|nr:SRPBCC family protein [Azospirillum baldaniorum]TWA55936.1 polyketide cyclase/dehydrase/lipid transport protein [Azospirillum baldaniorum]
MARVYVSAVIDAPVGQVWNKARDFNGHHAWHPIIADSHIEDGLRSDTVGCVRNFGLTPGGRLREQLVSFSDREHSYTYTILESPLPLTDYVATFRLTEVTEGNRTFGEWWADFDCRPEDLPTLREQVGRNTFAAGFRALADLCGGVVTAPAATPAPP